MAQHHAHVRLVPFATKCAAANCCLFDHLVGEEQHWGIFAREAWCCRLNPYARDLKAQSKPKDLVGIQTTNARVRRLTISSKKLGSMLYREHVGVKVRNPLLTLLRNSKIA